MIPSSTPSRQTGTVLAIAMIMLVLLTIIGLAGMRGTMMEERMAANTKEQHRALHAAELALARAEGDLEALYEGSAALPQGLGELGDCVTSNLATRVNIDDVLSDLSLNWQAFDDNPITAEEVVPFHFHLYCGDADGETARVREYRNEDGLNLTGDAGPGASLIDVHVYNTVGVGRVRVPPADGDPEVVLAESVVISSFGVITPAGELP